MSDDIATRLRWCRWRDRNTGHYTESYDMMGVEAERLEAAAEIERLRAALSGVVKVFVNPHDGGEYERGEIPALDIARDCLVQQSTNNG